MKKRSINFNKIYILCIISKVLLSKQKEEDNFIIDGVVRSNVRGCYT